MNEDTQANPESTTLPNEPEPTWDEQLERLHEQVMILHASGEFRWNPPSDPRLAAAQQLLDLIEWVRSSDVPGAPPGGIDATILLQRRKPLGPYTLIEVLGRGGMGVVFRARDARLGREVALKVVSPQRMATLDWKSRFQREARAASALNHPNILTVFEIGEADGQHFIATELVEGETLRRKMLARPLPLDEVLAYGTQLAGALAAAHAVGIIHRDLKPDNVMVRPDGLVKILDFGLAKQVVPLLANHPTESAGPEPTFASASGAIIGTIRYMSPEQARGLPVDARTDLFSLGVLLYELLAGQHPFEAATPSDVLAAILDRAPKPLSELRKDLPQRLLETLAKCMNKDRERRILSAEELLSELRPSTDAPPAAGAQSERTTRRNPNSSPNDHENSGRLIADPGREPDDAPVVRYKASGDVNIAYQVLGSGPFDIVFVMGWVSHLEWFWREPSFAAFLRRLASFSRVILFDKRGTGLSDKVPVDQLPTLEQRMDDVRAVMDAVGSRRAVLCGVSEGGPMSILFAATHPEKTIALVMIGCYARRLWAPDYPWGLTEKSRLGFLNQIRNDWGGPVGIEVRAPSRAEDPEFRRWWASYLRMGASPGAAMALTNMNAQIDVRPILPAVQVPTLVIHRREDRCLRVEEGRFLAEQIPGAKWIELPGADHLPFVGDQEEILNEIEEFLTGVRQPTAADRVVATVLYMTIEPSRQGVDSPDRTAPNASRQRFSTHVEREAELFRARHLRHEEEFITAAFDGPARAVRAAIAIGDSARRLGVLVRTGVHIGECDIVRDQVTGVTVERACRIARQAAIGDVLVSSTVRDLVVGSGLSFVDHSSLVSDDRPLSLFQVAR